MALTLADFSYSNRSSRPHCFKSTLRRLMNGPSVWQWQPIRAPAVACNRNWRHIMTHSSYVPSPVSSSVALTCPWTRRTTAAALVWTHSFVDGARHCRDRRCGLELDSFTHSVLGHRGLARRAVLTEGVLEVGVGRGVGRQWPLYYSMLEEVALIFPWQLYPSDICLGT